MNRKITPTTTSRVSVAIWVMKIIMATIDDSPIPRMVRPIKKANNPMVA